jgi:anti-anti-sigma regulatory factor
MEGEPLYSTDTYILKLEDRWTIERAHELKGVLVTALSGHDQVLIDIEEVTEVDLSFLQLLCAAHRTSLKKNKHFALRDRQSEAFSRVLRDAGYARTLGCHGDPYKSCLWKGGWGE